MRIWCSEHHISISGSIENSPKSRGLGADSVQKVQKRGYESHAYRVFQAVNSRSRSHVHNCKVGQRKQKTKKLKWMYKFFLHPTTQPRPTIWRRLMAFFSSTTTIFLHAYAYVFSIFFPRVSNFQFSFFACFPFQLFPPLLPLNLRPSFPFLRLRHPASSLRRQQQGAGVWSSDQG